MSEQATGGTGRFTVPEKTIHVEGDTGRPEVFIEASEPDLGPSATLVRDSDALELYEKLGDYLRQEGYDV